MKNEDQDKVRIFDMKVQNVPSEVFHSLESGDLLFIDSSHVMKCGNDLQVLFFNILPFLPPGIFVHFHDIFYPFEYPAEWLKMGRYWNESYFLRAFLSYNSQWTIYFWNPYVSFVYNDFIKKEMPLCLRDAGASLYIQRAFFKKLSQFQDTAPSAQINIVLNCLEQETNNQLV